MRPKAILFDLDGTLLPMDQTVFMKHRYSPIPCVTKTVCLPKSEWMQSAPQKRLQTKTRDSRFLQGKILLTMFREKDIMV